MTTDASLAAHAPAGAAVDFSSQAMAALQRSDLRSAEKSLRAWTRVEPGSRNAQKLHGLVLASMRRYKEALPLLDAAIQQAPDDVSLFLSKAESLVALRRFGAALTCSDEAVRIAPGRAESHFFRGTALLRLKQVEPAIASFRNAVAISPALTEAHFNQGAALTQLRLRSRRGEALRQEALACFNRVLELEPSHARALYGRALMLRDLGDLEGAIRNCDRAIELERDRRRLRAMRWFMAFCLVSSGNWERGWRYWESDLLYSRKRSLDASVPPWQGESLAGKSIAVFEEGGFGDTIQLARFAPSLTQMGARVELHLRSAVRPLILGSAGASAGCTAGATPTRYDYQTTFLALPALLDARPDRLPGVRGYLTAQPSKVSAWHEKLGKAKRLRVGVAWSGNPKQKEDVERSMRLADLSALFDVDADFVCLQKVLRPRDRRDFRSLGKMPFHGDELHDFTDTAALCETVDVVVSTCTSVAHLAGALGRPLWVMLARNADWRWMTDTETSVWYASARLFRQQRLGDWSPVVERARDELQILARRWQPSSKRSVPAFHGFGQQ